MKKYLIVGNGVAGTTAPKRKSGTRKKTLPSGSQQKSQKGL